MIPNPMQPIVRDRLGVLRFKSNAIVHELLTQAQKRGFGLNELHQINFAADDWVQFYQLIGSSLSGYGEIDVIPKAVVEAVDAMSEYLKDVVPTVLEASNHCEALSSRDPEPKKPYEPWKLPPIEALVERLKLAVTKAGESKRRFARIEDVLFYDVFMHVLRDIQAIKQAIVKETLNEPTPLLSPEERQYLIDVLTQHHNTVGTINSNHRDYRDAIKKRIVESLAKKFALFIGYGPIPNDTGERGGGFDPRDQR